MPTRDEYVDGLKSAALEIGKRAVMKLLVSKVPFFAGGFFGWVAGIIIGKVLTALIQETEFAAFFQYIDMRVDKQGDDFTKAALAWYNASPEEKVKYEKAYLDSFYTIASLKS
ncbi:MAG: hypothetical protein ACKOX6_11345 [Bdellovibrio sp.]